MVVAAIAGACAVDIPDVVTDGGDDSSTSHDVTSGGDASDAGPADVIVTPPTCDGGCGYSLPSNFGLVLFANGSQVCPQGSLPNPISVDPDASAACTCGCSVTQQPDCNNGTIQRARDNTATPTCNQQESQLQIMGASCLQHAFLSGILHRSFTPPTATGGTCSPQDKANAGAVTSTASVACVATSCTTQACSAPGFKLCAIASGQVACPAPFTVVHPVGVGSLSCAGCGPCTVSGTCTGVLHRYSDTACGTLAEDDIVDGGCEDATASSASYNYTGTFAGGCTPSGTSSPTLAGSQTLCCLP